SVITRVNDRMAELDGELKILTDERFRLEREQDGLLDSDRQLKFLLDLLSSFMNNFNNLSIHDKRAMIKILVQKITWDGRDIHIFTYGG
ncbi:MAG: recombinase family protein, partial [Firmicutes bacterium]|nr:recombinase family protein [Bacillota bacterium]